MINYINKISGLFVVIIVSMLINQFTIIKEEQNKLSELYTGSTYAEVSQEDLDINLFSQILTDLDNTEGIFISNAYLEDNGERQATFFVDYPYFNNYMQNIKLEGTSFTEEDFKIVFDKNTSIPVLVSRDFANDNNLKIGDKTTIENFLPNICVNYADTNIFLEAADGTGVENGTSNEKDKCISSAKYSYLENENGFDELPVNIIGIYESDSEFPSTSDVVSTVDVVAPRFIVNNENIGLIDLDAYSQNQLIITRPLVLLAIDYDTISQDEFNQLIFDLDQKYGVTLSVSRETDWIQFQIEEDLKLINQSLINYLFLLAIAIVIWCIQQYYTLLAFRYKYAVYRILGASNGLIIKRYMYENMVGYIIQLSSLLTIGYISNLLVIGLIVLVILWAFEFIILQIYNSKLRKQNITNILLGDIE